MPRSVKTLVGAIGLLCAMAAQATSVNQTPAVGKVSRALGKSYILHEGSKPALVQVGSEIHVGDHIETGSNGHVDIHFVDAELVTVRPLSRLQIERYDYDAARPENSAIKLNFLEGESHYISGKGAKAAPQNFRLNTPIAAIGVRGTDFTVNANAQSMRTFVNEGGIVVAPYSAACSPASLGPCSQDAVELSGISRQMLELNASTAGVQSALIPMNTTATQAAVVAAEESATASQAVTKKESKELYTNSVVTRTVNGALAVAEPRPAPPVAIEIKKTEFTPVVAESKDALTTGSQLIWGRWRDSNLQNERISVQYNDFVRANMAVTVGGLGYFLYREEPQGAVLKPGLGVLAFNLNKAQAQYKYDGKAELMSVAGGTLNIDFDKALFSTTLQLNHAALGNYTFATSGRIDGGGYFNSSNDTQEMAGAVSVDGQEAGYYFERIINTGVIEGLTLWGKQP